MKPIDISSKYLCNTKNILNPNTEQLFIQGVFVLCVASMETMILDILKYYLKNFPQKLSTEHKFEKNDFFENHFSLLERSIDKYIYGLSYESFGDYLKKFLKYLSIEWNDFQDSFELTFHAIKEDRNLLLHNGKVIHEKTGQSKINYDYLIRIVNNIINFEEELKKRIHEKYKEYTKVNANKRLWQFMFKTPLLASYDDYWYYNENKDQITGFKKSKYENALSSSEIMLLELWRTQFTGTYKNGFHMAHLVGETREKAMFFLSIAGDFSFE